MVFTKCRYLTVILLLCLMGCRGAPSTSTLVPTRAPQSTESPERPAIATPTTPAPTETPTPTTSATPTSEPIVYQAAFGIDYANPDQYLAQGDQTQISDPIALNPLRIQAEGMDHMAHIYQWLHREFETYRASGATIGVATVDGLLVERRMGGCHDFGLVFAAVVRELGYPAVMIDTYSIAWIEQFQAGTAQSHIGHVFVEVYLDGRWVLVDPTNGWYVEEAYDPTHPTIPLKGAIAGSTDEVYGFYVDLKGIDSWGYGVTSLAKLTQAMDNLAAELDLASVSYPTYKFEQFKR
jgi:transglutaminase-like putative cysteine protease